MPECAPAHLQHAEHGFPDNTERHFRLPFFPVFKCNWRFAHFKSERISGEFHFDLEGVADEADFIQVNGGEYGAFVADKAGGWVGHGHPENQAGVERCAVGEDDTIQGPVFHVTAPAVAGADCEVGAFVAAGCEQTWEVLRVVGKIGVHFEEIVIAAFQAPSKTGDIGRSQSQFACAFEEVEFLVENALQVAYDIRRAVRRAVVHDQYVKTLFQGEDRPDNRLDIFLFVVSRYNDEGRQAGRIL